jgi:hypothetical protein
MLLFIEDSYFSLTLLSDLLVQTKYVISSAYLFIENSGKFTLHILHVVPTYTMFHIITQLFLPLTSFSSLVPTYPGLLLS